MKKLIYLFITVSLAACKTQKKVVSSKKPTEKIMEKKKLSENLKFTVLKNAPENSPAPKAGNTVRVHYTGWLAEENGTKGRQIDSSVERGEPLEFTLGIHQVIRGFEDSAADMKLGEKREVVIPPALGYGEKGVGLFIPPNATLIFEIELVGIA